MQMTLLFDSGYLGILLAALARQSNELIDDEKRGIYGGQNS
jgi:hypothetical protein